MYPKSVEEYHRLKDGWFTLEAFEKEAEEGWCWIAYKGKVVMAYYDHEKHFRSNKYGGVVYMTECVSWVMPIEKPEPPKE